MANKSNKQKKLKRKQNQEKELRKENVTFEIISLLRDSELNTKPEVGTFLKNYVKNIRVLNNNSKITLYPITEYKINKVFIDFLDQHQIIADFSRNPREYYLYHGVEEQQIADKDLHYIKDFIVKLEEFRFIF